jgi:hypothetical protein
LSACFKTKVYASTVVAGEELWHRIQQLSIEIKKIQLESSDRAELCAGEHGGHLEHFLQENKNEEVINSFCLL